MKNKVISISDRKQYSKEIKHIIEKLEVYEKEIFGSMIKLATIKEWKDWTEKQKEGTVFTFEKEMFENCKDKNLIKLYNLRETLDLTIRELTQANNA